MKNSMERPIVVLGEKGMLGQMVCAYFKKEKFKVYSLKNRFSHETRDAFIKEILGYKNAIVINCIGKIKQKTEDANDLLWANAVLPLELNNSLPKQFTLIHPSTDCVFDGLSGNPYKKEQLADARDDYGWSKRLGEVALINRTNTLLIRVSIIGLDQSVNPKGLLGWFLSNKPGDALKGYENHLWNGITTLEWCKTVHKLLMENDFENKPCLFLQIGTKEYYNKYEMLKLFQDIYETHFTITPFSTPENMDRRLVPELIVKPLPEQLKEMRFFFDKK